MKQRKRTKRRILSVVLTLVMVFSTITGIVPGGVMTAKADTTYNVWVAGVQVTDDNKDDVLGGADGDVATVKFTPATGSTPDTLILNGASITGSHEDAAIYAEGDLAIEVETDSAVIGSGDTTLPVPGIYKTYGIYLNGDNTTLTISGGKKLTVGIEVNATNFGRGGEDYYKNLGVVANNIIVKKNSDLNVLGLHAVYSASDSTVTVEEGGVLTATGYHNGINVLGSVRLGGSGTVTANGGSYGIQAGGNGTKYKVFIDDKVNLTSTGNPVFCCIFGIVYNKSLGYAWTKISGTEEKRDLPIRSNTGLNLDYCYKVQFPVVRTPVNYMAWNEEHKAVEDVQAPCTCYMPVNYTFNSNNAYYKDQLGDDGEETWYVVNSNNSTNCRFLIKGTVNLILCDSKTLETSGGFDVSNGSTLNIYAQSNGNNMGKLTVNSSASSSSAGIGGSNQQDLTNNHDCSTVNIHGGKIDVEGSRYAPAIGGSSNGSGGTITIYGGNVNAINNRKNDNESFSAIGAGKKGTGGVLVINGGELCAETTGTNQKAINATIKNSINGKYYSSGQMVIVDVNEEGQEPPNARKVYFPGPHVHKFTYKVGTGENSNTIIATCTAAGCTLDDETDQHNHTATLTITAPASLAYNGSPKGVQIDDKNSIQGDATVSYFTATKTGEVYTKGTALNPNSAPVNAGDYWAEITLGDGENAATVGIGYTIDKVPMTAPYSHETYLCGIDYIEETATPSNGFEVTTDNTNDTAETVPLSITSVFDGEGKIYLRRTPTDDNYAPSEWVEMEIGARPSAPNNLGSTNATKVSSADGTITGVNDRMEYSINGTDWTTVPSGQNTITGLNPGKYSVRIKAATYYYPHGTIAMVTVGVDYDALTESNKPTISVSDDHNPPVIGDKLTASTTATDILYEWYRDGEKIEGENKDTYTLTKEPPLVLGTSSVNVSPMP